jgi:hypothetical protein
MSVSGRERVGDPYTHPHASERPKVAPPCRCRRPLYLGGEQCLMCGRQRPMKIDLRDYRIKSL